MRWAATLCVILCVTAMTAINLQGQDSYKLTEISVEQARELIAKATKKSPLRLDGLTTLSPEVASELAMHRGRVLGLDGLTTLSPEIAAQLAKHKGEILSLNGLKTLCVSRWERSPGG